MTLALKLTHINKTFKTPTEKRDSLREYFTHFHFLKPLKSFRALKDINFELGRGEWLGVIGANGSGKSTLLKVIAGIYEPDRGQVEVSGHLVPFLELGVGFNPELSAKDNIFLNGVILGMSRREIRNAFTKIVRFAGVKSFLSQKLKNFSSGQQVRLGFAIAIQASGDIFLLDEVLAVGDYLFQKKSDQIFKTMRRQQQTAILVSHDLEQIKRYCDRVIWLDRGKIAASGKPKAVIECYTRSVIPK